MLTQRLVPAQRLLLAATLLAILPATAVDAHNCRCRNRGVMFNLGQTSCLRVDGRTYLARCEMKLNVSSWTDIGQGCPVTSRQSNISEPQQGS